MNKSINQINAFTANNETIQYYRFLSSDDERYKRHWQNGSYEFQKGRGGMSVTGNYIYVAACVYFSRFISTNEIYNYNRDTRTCNVSYSHNGCSLDFNLRMRQDIYGVHMSCETNMKGLGRSLISQYSILVKSNSTFAGLDMAQYFEKHILPEYLFPFGMFRNIQIVYNCNKKEALRIYKEFISVGRTIESDFVDMEKALRHRYTKKFNIVPSFSITVRDLKNNLHHFTKNKKRKYLHKLPSVIEMSDMYSQEYDTDDHLEGFVDETMNDFPENSIFIN